MLPRQVAHAEQVQVRHAQLAFGFVAAGQPARFVSGMRKQSAVGHDHRVDQCAPDLGGQGCVGLSDEPEARDRDEQVVEPERQLGESAGTTTTIRNDMLAVR